MSTSGKDTAWQTDQYKVVPFQYLPEITKDYDFPDPFEFRDISPEKMDRLEGARLFSPDDYLEVCTLLANMGVTKTKFLTTFYDGTPRGETIFDGLRAVGKAGLGLEIFTNLPFWARYRGKFIKHWENDEYKNIVDKVVSCGAGGVDLVMQPTPYFSTEPIWDGKKIIKEVAPDFAEALSHAPKAIQYAQDRGLSVVANTHLKRMNPDDTDLTGITSVFNYYIEHGVDGLGLSDANGACNPAATKWLISTIRKQLTKDVPIYYHVHDNFGMATAQVIAAASAGAIPQTSINGIADRGFPDLAEVAAALEMMYGVNTGIDLLQLPKASRVMQRISGVPMPPYKAVTGDLISLPYSPESHVAMLTLGETWPQVDGPYDPAMVGLRTNFGITYATLHNKVVRAILEHTGAEVSESMVEDLYSRLQERLDSFGGKYPIVVDEGEVRMLCEEVLKG